MNFTKETFSTSTLKNMSNKQEILNCYTCDLKSNDLDKPVFIQYYCNKCHINTNYCEPCNAIMEFLFEPDNIFTCMKCKDMVLIDVCTRIHISQLLPTHKQNFENDHIDLNNIQDSEASFFSNLRKKTKKYNN